MKPSIILSRAIEKIYWLLREELCLLRQHFPIKNTKNLGGSLIYSFGITEGATILHRETGEWEESKNCPSQNKGKET